MSRQSGWRKVCFPGVTFLLLLAFAAALIFFPEGIPLFKNRAGSALAAARQAVKENPADSDARFRLGKMYYDNGDYTQARLQFETLAGIGKNNSRAVHYLGRTYMQLGMLNLAEETLAGVLDQTPFPEAVYTDLGELALINSDYRSAIIYYNLALGNGPGTAENFLRLAVAYEARSMYSEASASLEKALRLLPAESKELSEKAANLKRRSQMKEAAQ